MTNQQILEKAIKKAIDNGWKFNRVDMLDVPKELATWAINPFYPKYPGLIFNHDFAKALWGEKRIIAERHIEADGYAPMELLEALPAWQYHLQMMVISEDPIKYLGDNI